MVQDEPGPHSFRYLTTGGQLLIEGSRSWTAGGAGSGTLLETMARAGLAQDVAPMVAFLEIMALVAVPPIRCNPVRSAHLSSDEVTLVDALSALQHSRWELGHQVLAVRLPPAALRHVRDPALKLVRAMARQGLWIGFRTADPMTGLRRPIVVRPPETSFPLQ